MITSFKIFESEKQKRAGSIPYFIENGEIKMLFFIPSNPAFGGDKYQISKGRIDAGESPEVAAVRECMEETGLPEENIKSVEFLSVEKIAGNDEYYYELFVYLINNKWLIFQNTVYNRLLAFFTKK